jgi:hypothetical protein
MDPDRLEWRRQNGIRIRNDFFEGIRCGFGMDLKVGSGSQKGGIRNTLFQKAMHTWLPGPAGSGGLAALSPAAGSLTRKVESGSGMTLTGSDAD